MCQRVGRQVNLSQLRTIDMRVDLRRRYIGVSQDLLQHAKVRAAREHMGGKEWRNVCGWSPTNPTWRP